MTGRAVAASISRLVWQVQKADDQNKTVVGMKIALLAYVLFIEYNSRTIPELKTLQYR